MACVVQKKEDINLIGNLKEEWVQITSVYLIMGKKFIHHQQVWTKRLFDKMWNVKILLNLERHLVTEQEVYD